MEKLGNFPWIHETWMELGFEFPEGDLDKESLLQIHVYV